MLSRDSCSCTMLHKDTIQPRAVDSTGVSGRGGHEKTQKIITLFSMRMNETVVADD